MAVNSTVFSNSCSLIALFKSCPSTPNSNQSSSETFIYSTSTIFCYCFGVKIIFYYNSYTFLEAKILFSSIILTNLSVSSMFKTGFRYANSLYFSSANCFVVYYPASSIYFLSYALFIKYYMLGSQNSSFILRLCKIYLKIPTSFDLKPICHSSISVAYSSTKPFFNNSLLPSKCTCSLFIKDL